MRTAATVIGITAALWGSASFAQGQGVKMSRAGACYAVGHVAYDAIETAAVFPTMTECKGMGGVEAGAPAPTASTTQATTLHTTTTVNGDHLWVDSHIQMPAPVYGLPTAGYVHPLRAPWSTTNMPCAPDTDPASADVIVRQDLGTSYQYFESAKTPSLYKGDSTGGCTYSVPIGPQTYVDQAFFAERHAYDTYLARQRAAFDLMHGVTPAERAAGPDPVPASYPEGRKVPTVHMPYGAVVPGMIAVPGGYVPAYAVHPSEALHGKHAVPAPQQGSLYKHQSPSGNLLDQTPATARTAPDGTTYGMVLPTMGEQTTNNLLPNGSPRPPIALPGAYRGATVARVTEQGQTGTLGETASAAQDTTSMEEFVEAAGGADFGTGTPEEMDAMAEQMEAQGIMPPGYAPGTAPDVNDILSGQGIDPSTLPGFDGNPAMMGMGAGATVTFGD